MNTFFDKETGVFRLDEMVSENESFKKIIEDGVVTDDELLEQSTRVIDLFKQLEERLSEADLKLVSDSVSELAVLYAINQYKEIQELRS